MPRISKNGIFGQALIRSAEQEDGTDREHANERKSGINAVGNELAACAAFYRSQELGIEVTYFALPSSVVRHPEA